MKATPRITLFLVHGTWSDRRWIQVGSSFAKEFRSEFGEAVEICPFEWSGTNSQVAREVAGESLAAALLTRATESNSNIIIIVAHSHGGNVVIHALRQKNVSDRVRGIVFLSTPFFVFEPRRLKWLHKLPLLHTSKALNYITILGTVLLALCAGISPFLSNWPGEGKYVLWRCVASAVLVIAVLLGVEAIRHKLPSMAKKINGFVHDFQNLQKRLCAPLIENHMPHVSIYHPTDEAAFWLRGITRVGSPFSVLPHIITVFFQITALAAWAVLVSFPVIAELNVSMMGIGLAVLISFLMFILSAPLMAIVAWITMLATIAIWRFSG